MPIQHRARTKGTRYYICLCLLLYGANIREGPTFFLSGTADIDSSGKIIAEGDTGAAAMQKRARFTIDTVGATLEKLKVSWEDTTQIALFHVADIPNLWGSTLLGTLGEAVRRGVLVYHARPPLVGAEVELEARAVRQELIVATN